MCILMDVIAFYVFYGLLEVLQYEKHNGSFNLSRYFCMYRLIAVLCWDEYRVYKIFQIFEVKHDYNKQTVLFGIFIKFPE